MLLIQSWVVPGTAIQAALRAGGYEPRIFRVDFEPALIALLSRGTYDVVLLDAASTNLTRATVEAAMREHGVKVPLLDLGDVAGLADAIRSVRAARRN